MNEEYLEHHGIKGQKWGIRRFQNENGSLTSAGRKRYNVGKPKTIGSQSYPSYDEMQQVVKQKSMEKAYDKAVNNKSRSQRTSEIKNTIDQTKNTINTISNAYKNSKNSKQTTLDLSKMSNKELQDAITRMNLEDNYTRLIRQREAATRGKDYVEKTLDTLGTVAQVASAATIIATAIYAVQGK